MKICDFDRQFLLGSYLLRFARNGTKKQLRPFMAVQKLRSYTKQLMHNDMPKLDYLYFASEYKIILFLTLENKCHISKATVKCSFYYVEKFNRYVF